MSKKLDTSPAVIGIDIGKNSFHIVGQNRRGAMVLRQKWSRGQVEARLANLPPCRIGMEACVGAHHLSRVDRRRTLTPHMRSQSSTWDADRRPNPTPINTVSLAPTTLSSAFQSASSAYRPCKASIAVPSTNDSLEVEVLYPA